MSIGTAIFASVCLILVFVAVVLFWVNKERKRFMDDFHDRHRNQ